MKISRILGLAVVLGVMQGSIALAKDAAVVKILSPANNAQVDAGETYPLSYEVTPGPGGNHFHVWVDNERGPGVHDSKGTYTLPKLSPGAHVITIKVVDKGHVPTGPAKSINVTAK
jgi:hypothetical protein